MISRIKVGNDISKLWFDICAFIGKEVFTKRYPNTPDGHRQFVDDFSALGGKVHVCMEHTGGYETAVALACREAGFRVSLVDGAQIVHFRKSHGAARHKTDRTCAFYLARYCIERKPEEWFPMPDEHRALRELVRHRERLIESKTEWATRSQHIVENSYVAAQRRSICEHLSLQVEAIEQEIERLVEAHESLREAVLLLRTIPGVAFKSAIRILSETGPISNYNSAKDYALAAGLVPIVCNSGHKVPPGKLPVYGNRQLRCALYFPVVVCCRHKRGVYPFMQRVSKNGPKAKMAVLTAGMRKLAHIIFGVLKSQQPFDPLKI